MGSSDIETVVLALLAGHTVGVNILSFSGCQAVVFLPGQCKWPRSVPTARKPFASADGIESMQDPSRLMSVLKILLPADVEAQEVCFQFLLFLVFFFKGSIIEIIECVPLS